jgi:hypothetical protein
MIRFTFSKLSKACAAGLLSVASLAALPAAAQNVPVNYPGGNTPRTNPGNYPTGSLTNGSLAGFLTSLGLHPETRQGNNGDVVACDLPFETTKCKGKIMVSISPDQSKVWMVVGIGKIGRAAQSPAVLQQLMQYNDTLGALAFAMDENGYVTLKKVIDNINVTRERFTTEASKLLDAIDATHPFWMPLLIAAAAETQGQPAPAPAPAPAPSGGDVGNDGRLFPGRH